MYRTAKKSSSAALSALIFSALILGLSPNCIAGDPHSAFYGPANDRIFWFIQTSDTHIGTSGSQDSNNLSWIVNQARQVIDPSFILVTGDLTDSTDANWLGWPDGPHQAEWDAYKNIIASSGIPEDQYYDIPGNHDAYNDQDFSYYLNNSIHGRATGRTQASFVRTLGFGTYHFLGINTADNTGDGFSLTWPFGDYAGLDSSELSFISTEMAKYPDSDLTMVFGHHPLFDTGNADDTYVYYGLPSFLSFMDQSYSSLYGYGHTHDASEAFYVPDAGQHEGFHYFNVASLGKSSSNQYTIMAIDCNGLSSKINTVGSWPAVLITAPLDEGLGGLNPYGYAVPAAASNPIRALVFDANTVTSVQYRVDGSTSWFPMNRVAANPRLWEALWDAASLAAGLHTLEVKASSASGTKNDIIKVRIEQNSQPKQVGAAITKTGKYVTSGTRKNKVTTFQSATSFIQGESVIFWLQVGDTNSSPISGATVQLKIEGQGLGVTLTSTSSDSSGSAEAVWTTSAPNKRATGGTTPGTYTATVTGVAVSGYAWDSAANSATITIVGK